MTTPEQLVQQTYRRQEALKLERSSWFDHWRDISNYLFPRAGRFLLTDHNKGGKRNRLIIDSTGTRGMRILGAGMMSGMTSPARPWFRLGPGNPELKKNGNVKAWCYDVTQRMLRIFSVSNTYRFLHGIYEEMGAFGTAATVMTSHYDSVIWGHQLTIGEFCIATDQFGTVDTIYREYMMTVKNVVDQFGYSKCSTRVKNLYDKHSYDEWITIIHAIEPRPQRNEKSRFSTDMAWQSVYIEVGHPVPLRVSGFRRFPALCPRWYTTGGNVYGDSPGMDALGDIQQLQEEQLDKSRVISLGSNPPVQVPSNLKNEELDLLPGGIVYVDSQGGNNGVRTAFETNLNISHLAADIDDIRRRINESFFTDLFLMIAENPNSTATEVLERKEEKMLMLGPVIERLENELLDKLISITFEKMLEADALPPLPEELHGQDITVEYVSVLAQAQKAVNTNSTTRMISIIGTLAAMKPDVLDKFDADEAVEDIADSLGINPKLIIPSKTVALIRQERAEEAARQQQQAVMAQIASSAAQQGDQQITDAMGMFSGYGGV